MSTVTALEKERGGLKRTSMPLLVVVAMVFTLVCSGAYGGEDSISASGPGFTLLLLLVLPFLWSLPMALVSAELGSALPAEGGFYRWVRRGLGEFWGFQSGWWSTVDVFVDSAVYIALFGEYVQTWFHLSQNETWLIGVAVIAVLAYLNIRGLEITGWLLTAMQAFLLTPFVVLVVLALLHVRTNPFVPFVPPGESVISATGLGLAIWLWMYNGYSSMSTMSGEVEQPQRIIPRALLITVPVVIGVYTLSMIGGLAGVGHWQQWSTAGDSSSISFVQAGQLVTGGGRWLGWWLLGGAVVSNLALYVGYLASGARPAFVMSRDRLLPRFMGRVHKRYGTPVVTIIAVAAVNAVLIRWGFATLIVVDVFLIMLSNVTIFIACCVLRYSEPDLRRPYRIPLPNWGVVAICVPPILLCVYELFANGMQTLVGGCVAILSGPLVYVVFKHLRKGVRQEDVIASEDAEIEMLRDDSRPPIAHLEGSALEGVMSDA
jgi:amino acid transporter